jgi:hypothetical protein
MYRRRAPLAFLAAMFAVIAVGLALAACGGKATSTSTPSKHTTHPHY